MPQADPDLKEKMIERFGNIDTHGPCRFLEDNGLHLDRRWCWYTDDDRELTDDEAECVLFLITEWDFGGYIRRELAEKPDR